MRGIAIILLVSFLVLNTKTSLSQDIVSKKELYQDWVKHLEERENPSNYKVGFDSIVSVFIDSLKLENIDTIGAYEQDYVGMEVYDSCMCGIIPWEAYVNWIDNGVTYYKRFTECCRFTPIEIEYSVLINYYKNSQEKIDNQIILPVVTKAFKNKEGKIESEFMLIDHTTDFTLFCTFGKHSRFTRFSYYELANTDGIFQKDNEDSSINSWRKMIDNQVEEIEN